MPSTASESHGLEGTEVDSVTIQSVKAVKAQRSLTEWSQRVADCRSSGQPVARWCAEHDINPKTYYNWQKKVFAAMVEQQQLQLEAPQESKPRFAELQPPAVQNNLVAAVRIGEVSLDVYSGASAEVVTALCKALRNVK